MWLKKQKQTFFTQSQVWSQLHSCDLLHWIYWPWNFFFFPKHTCICLHAFLNMSANLGMWFESPHWRAWMNPVQWLCLPALLPAWTGMCRAECSKGGAGGGKSLLRVGKGKKYREQESELCSQCETLICEAFLFPDDQPSCLRRYSNHLQTPQTLSLLTEPVLKPSLSPSVSMKYSGLGAVNTIPCSPRTFPRPQKEVLLLFLPDQCWGRSVLLPIPCVCTEICPEGSAPGWLSACGGCGKCRAWSRSPAPGSAPGSGAGFPPAAPSGPRGTCVLQGKKEGKGGRDWDSARLSCCCHGGSAGTEEP